jgi:ATP-dependent Lon protease
MGGFVLVLQEHGLSAHELLFPQAALSFVIEGYTREAGVRSLERHVAALCRTVAVEVVAAHDDETLQRAAEGEGGEESPGRAPAAAASGGAPPQVVVTKQWVEQVLGPVRFDSCTELAGRVGQAGTVVGLAWTAAGGDVMLVEATAMAARGDRGTLTLTGQLGDVLKESAHIALAWVRQKGQGSQPEGWV